MKSRRDAIGLALGAASLACWVPPLLAQHVNRLGPWRRGADGRRIADLGNATYINPVFAGDHPDPTIIHAPGGYYATFASADYWPGPVIWQSTDLLNWAPVGAVMQQPIGTIHGPELVLHKKRYYLYFTAIKDQIPSIHVVHTDDICGAWSAPVDLGLTGHREPAHVIDEHGARYLFLADGMRVRLHANGLAVAGQPERVYDGWPIPSTYINEGYQLDGSKLIRRSGVFYLFASEGGQAGPANGHLAAVARARSLDGPWENSPHNPLVRADARDDPWWSRGRTVPVEGPDGRWWILYHAYEKNLRTLGRQAILEPLEWQADGWPVAKGGILDAPLPAPTKASASTSGQRLGGPVTLADFGPRLAFYRPAADYMNRVTVDDGMLRLAAQGNGPADSSPLAMIAGDRRFDLSVEIALHDGCEAGLLLFYNDKMFCGLASANGVLKRYKLGQIMSAPPLSIVPGQTFHLRLIYKEDVASFYCSQDGKNWDRAVTFEVSGYNANMSGDLLSLRPAVFAARDGSATFTSLKYDGAI